MNVLILIGALIGYFSIGGFIWGLAGAWFYQFIGASEEEAAFAVVLLWPAAAFALLIYGAVLLGRRLGFRRNRR